MIDFEELTCASSRGSEYWVLNDDMRRQGLIEEISLKVSLTLFLERIGEAESLVQLGLEEGIGAEARLDHEKPRWAGWVSVEE